MTTMDNTSSFTPSAHAQILADLARTGHTGVDRFSHLTRTPADTWTVADVNALHTALTGPLFDAAEALGWDPAMLPTPPTPVVEPAGHMYLLPNHRVQIALTRPNPPLVRELLRLPGFRKEPDSTVSGPVAATVITGLRRIVVANKILVAKDAAEALRDEDARTIGQVSLTPGGRVLVQAPPNKTLVDELTRVPGLRWIDAAKGWQAPGSRLVDVIKVAERHSISMTDQVAERYGDMTAPFDYDGTLDGLRGIPVTTLACVDEGKAERLESFGVKTLYDLLMLVPRRYLDRSTITPIREVKEGDDAALIGRVTNVRVEGPRRMVRFDVTDGTGTMKVTFFNALWQGKRFRVGDEVILLGKVEAWKSATRITLSMTNPVMDPIGEETLPIIPVYPQSAKSRVSTWDILSAALEALTRIGHIADPLPDEIVHTTGLVDRNTAFTDVHFPSNVTSATEGRRRLAFDELFRLQTALLLTKSATDTEVGIQHQPTGQLVDAYLSAFPYPLTGAQERAWEQIRKDLTSEHPMHRLLQGDVGSGKTVMAAVSLLTAVESGHQGALMAPTEILATQLYRELAERLEGVTFPDGRPIRVALLTNKSRGKARTRMLEELKSGDIHILVGTHALLVGDVEFASLGLVVVDEQHRFGVRQRASLREKGQEGVRPDMLVMTATPIPRTAAMTTFGDLEVSVLDELPPGRTPIRTTWLDMEPDLGGSLFSEPWESVRAQIAQGRQAYVVCPLVEESEKLQAASATETFESLRTGPLEGLRVGLVHGQQKADERETTMAAFRDGELDVLVATTVIEVGVNVPNATVIVILDPARFGIAQLHQLRGRVGRGLHASECVLLGRGLSPDSRTRLTALCESTDGFYLSEVDLQLRGAGNLLGDQQAGGFSDLRVADLLRDTDLLNAAREQATRLLATDPGLARRPGLRAEITTAVGPEQAAWLFRS